MHSHEHSASIDPPLVGAKPTHARRWFPVLLIALFILQMGGAITTIALPLFVVDRYGISSELGIAMALRLLPVVLAGGMAAWALSRFDGRWIAIVSTVATGLLTASIPLTASLAELNVVSMAAGFTSMFGGPALMAMRVNVIPQDQAVRGNGLIVAAERTPSVLGPAAAAGMLAFTDASHLLLVEACATVIAGAIMLTLPPLRAETPERTGPLAILNIGRAWALIGGSRRVGGYLVTAFFYTAALSAGNLALVTIASTSFGSIGSAYSWLLGSMALGAVFGGLGGSRFGQRSLGHLYLVGNVLEGLVWMFVGFLPSIELVCGSLFLAGILEAVATTAFFADIQLRLPAATVGRLFAVYGPMTTATSLLGALIGSGLVTTGQPWTGTLAVGALIALPLVPFIRTFAADGR